MIVYLRVIVTFRIPPQQFYSQVEGLGVGSTREEVRSRVSTFDGVVFLPRQDSFELTGFVGRYYSGVSHVITVYYDEQGNATRIELGT